MTIEQVDIIDWLGIDTQTNKLHVTTIDHIDWDGENDDEHLRLLQAKLNSCLTFVENAEHLEVMPEAEGLPIRLVVIGQFPLNARAIDFYHEASASMAVAGFELVFEHRRFEEELH
jgi:hypothetical protein